MRDLTTRGIALLPKNFFRYLEEGDQEVIDLFVRANFNVNMVDADGAPPLIFALKRGLTIIAQILLSAGADPNAKDRLGLTPLLIACGKATEGYKNTVEMLLKKGAHINVRDPLGNTPCCWRSRAIRQISPSCSSSKAPMCSPVGATAKLRSPSRRSRVTYDCCG